MPIKLENQITVLNDTESVIWINIMLYFPICALSDCKSVYQTLLLECSEQKSSSVHPG